MTTTQWFLVGAGVVITVIGGWLSFRYVRITDAREKERALQHMHGRPPLDDTDFGQRYFRAEQSDIAARVRRILAGHIPVDLSRLHPDDKLVEDIRMDALDSMSTVEFVLEVEKEFGISIPDSVAAEMRTLRDVIDYVTAHLSKVTV
jgi:acyl carrier protein